jgi:Amt family ammonium transporter
MVVPDPSYLIPGDNSWQLTAASLVGLQSIPGLAVLYAGIVKKKWAINSAFMVFYAFSAVLVVWVLWAYKMGFGVQWGAAPFVGTPGPLTTNDQELAQALLPTSGITANFPMATMVYFQFVFAAITVIIMGGAFLGRMNFTAWMIVSSPTDGLTKLSLICLPSVRTVLDHLLLRGWCLQSLGRWISCADGCH